MTDNAIRREDEWTRKRLRRALGGKDPRKVMWQTLMALVSNEVLPPQVREAAKNEIGRRYSIAINRLGKALGGKTLLVEERLLQSPKDVLDDQAASDFQQKHGSRADVWLQLRLESEHGGLDAATQWLAWSLHRRLLALPFLSVEELRKAGPTEDSRPLKFVDAMYGYGHGLVWAGFKWQTGTTIVNVPPNHHVYVARHWYEVKTFAVSCALCAHRESGMREDGMLRCPGTDRPRDPGEVARIVDAEGCPEFFHVNVKSIVKTRPILSVVRGGKDS